MGLVFLTFNRTRVLYEMGWPETIELFNKNFASTKSAIWFFLVNADFSVAYDNYLYILKNINNFGELFGSTLVKVFIFFIPRSVWPDKPLDAQGLIVEEGINYTFAGGTSQSMNFIGELYWNYGFLGPIFIFFLMGLGLRIVDSKTFNFSSYTKTFYILFSPAIFLLWRGAVSTTFIDSILSLFAAIAIFSVSLFFAEFLPNNNNN